MSVPSNLARRRRRALNVVNRWRAGLPLRGESISPEVRNDHLIGHLSLYEFFARHAQDAAVLDIGCGAGYGSEVLLAGGAVTVTAVDVDPRYVAYARRHYEHPAVRFIEGNAQSLPTGLGRFDLIVSSNVFEHLDDPQAALAHVCARLKPSGKFILGVPPITDAESQAVHQGISYHRSNLTIDAWRATLGEHFEVVQPWQHRMHEGHTMDMTSPFPSQLSTGSFWFAEAPTTGDYRTLCALFVASRPRAGTQDVLDALPASQA
jgi:SAM-dependent methyltransferase